ncbi:MAG TPA: hypothetical protein VG842_08390 [Sediminibacterium sp.]|nr:hypothetical protein [Sediminibacterium sp.]
MKKISIQWWLLCILVTGKLAAQQGVPQPPTPEQKLRHVTEMIDKQMTLTGTQQDVIRKAYRDFFQAEEALRKKSGRPEMPPPPPPPPADKAAMDKLVQQRDAKIKSVLSADAYQKYQALEQSMRPPGPGGAPGKAPAPPAKRSIP